MKIFIEVPTWLGDAIMTTPAIENIISSYVDVQLTIFGSFVSTTLFKNHPNIEKIIIDNSKKTTFRYKNLYNYAKSSGQFDIAISFRKNFTTKVLFYFLDAKSKYIYKRYDNRFGTHQVVRYNDFINNKLNLATTPKKLKIYQDIKYESISNVKYKDVKLFGINPGATYGSAKRWYPREFA
jgi:heptosyltransferase-2